MHTSTMEVNEECIETSVALISYLALKNLITNVLMQLSILRFMSVILRDW